MSRLTNGQRAGLEALCRLIIPTAFDDVATSDIAVLVESRIFDLPPFHRKRALFALSLWRFLPRRFYFESVRRLILHTHYGRGDNRSQSYPWEGPLPDALPIVATRMREREQLRVVPSGVFEQSPQRNLRTEFCIVGSGVGGAMAAAILAEAGRNVVVLEDGGYYTPSDYSDSENVAVRTLYADGGLRTTDSLNVSILQGRCAGGGSTVNWMVMLRTPEYVIEEWR
ncbi:MAG TPA: GMC family oxidoreductase N-terminal domain-containing protein, partial [Longimicrobiales bacterium]|nr:GMC family oxidoreductase N-terminal domain-containing protein [Longimicrobiales bacterium]